MVNAAFGPLMTGDRATLQAQYVGLSPYRPDTGGQPAVIALPVPEPYGQRRVAGYAIEKSQPGAVGAFVHWLIRESGWTVTERTMRDELPMAVPIEPRHVCILFRRFLQFGQDVTRPYVEALEARGVPHLLVGGKSFHDREEVETIRAALAAIEWPDDELSVFATLRGALFAIDDETLLEYRHHHHGFHPFRVPDEVPPELRPVADALRLLRRLHGGRNYRPVADTITQLLNATRAHVGFVLRQAGEQSLANVLHVAELARQYEVNGGMSFRGFVEELRDQADGGQAAEAPILEEGSDGVRLMTVHKAKGLEFPVVILADMTAKLRADRADRLIDRANNACYLRLGRWTPIELATNEALEIARDEAEGVRVAYVAATRARDLLVVPAVGDVAWDGGWTAPLNGAIYPRHDGAAGGNRGGRVPGVQEGLGLAASRQRSVDAADGVPRRTTRSPDRRAVSSRVVGSARARSRRRAGDRHPARDADHEGRARQRRRRRPSRIREVARRTRGGDREGLDTVAVGADRDRMGGIGSAAGSSGGRWRPATGRRGGAARAVRRGRPPAPVERSVRVGAGRRRRRRPRPRAARRPAFRRARARHAGGGAARRGPRGARRARRRCTGGFSPRPRTKLPRRSRRCSMCSRTSCSAAPAPPKRAACAGARRR